MQNLQLIEVKQLGATSRISLKDHRLNESKFIPMEYRFNTISEQAIDYLTSLGFNVIGTGYIKDGSMIVCSAVDNQFLSIKQ